MILYTAITVITVCLASLVQRQPEGNGAYITKQQGLNIVGISSIFLLLFGLAAFRLGVGNDYGTYINTCHEIFVGGYVVTEPGFNFVVKTLYTIVGSTSYLVMFAFFAFMIAFVFLKAIYEQSPSFQMGIFLFMALGLYFRTFNTVRYYFVLGITLYAIKYVTRKQYGKFIITILFAALFHKSVLVVIPMYLIAQMKWKKYYVIVLAVASGAVMLCQDLIMKIALILYPSYVDTIYLDQTSDLLTTISNIGRCGAVVALAVFFYKDAIENDEINQFHLKLNILAIALYASCWFLPLISRFGYYLMTSQIVFVPRMLSMIGDEKKKKLATIAVVLVGILFFLDFLRTASADGIRVLPYHSWLFYEEEWRVGNSLF
ncbi:MAG: EpsG family protein [Eubacteriales bacterium]